MTPDLHRVGGLEWTRRTRGALSSRERRRLLGEIVRAQGAYVAGRIRLLTGRTPEGACSLALGDFRPPDSALARDAEEACAEQPAAVIGHSYRSWVFGRGLAVLDASALDEELFYVACLLHDHGIADPVEGEDFTLRSAARVERLFTEAGEPPESATLVGDAITVHATPGITPEHDGALGFYVQSGAMFDLAGMRAGDLPRGFREDAIRAHPRAGVTREIARLVRAEARAVPKGRFALIHRCGFNALMWASPHRPR